MTYGPRETEGAPRVVGVEAIVVPRPGTISPWSSKATDIAHNCGLDEIERLERGIAWYLRLPANCRGLRSVQALERCCMTG